MIYKAVDYKTREELETAIITDSGETTDIKDSVIEGTEKELENLQLGKRNVVWGVKVNSSNSKKKIKVENNKINRGKIYKGGINLEK